MRATLITILLIVVGTTSLSACAPYESRFLRVPRTMWQAPERATVLDIPTQSDTTIKSWLFRPADAPATAPLPALIMAHGRTDSMADYRHIAPQLADATGAAVILFDYRGFGASSDLRNPTRQTMIDDTAALLAHLRTHPGLDPDRFILWGISLGAYPAAANFADDPSIDALILWGAPANIKTLIRDGHEELNPISRLLAGMLIPRHRAPEDELKGADARPVLIVHAEHDHIVRIHHAHSLAESAPHADLLIDTEGTHTSISKPTLDAIIRWLRPHLPSTPVTPTRAE